MAGFVDYYEILQVNPFADPEVIEKAYKALIFKHHPDRGGDEEEARRLTGAYYVLGDANRRREYDARRAAWFAQEPNRGQRGAGHGRPAQLEDIPPAMIDAILARVWVEGAGATVRTAARVALSIASYGADAIAGALTGPGDPIDRGLGEQDRRRFGTARDDADLWRPRVSERAIAEYARLLDRRVSADVAEALLTTDELAWIATKHERAAVRRRAYLHGTKRTGTAALLGKRILGSVTLISGVQGSLQEAPYSAVMRVWVNRASFGAPRSS